MRSYTRRIVIVVLVVCSVVFAALAASALGRGAPRATLRGHGCPVYAIRFSPNGLTLASRGADDRVKLWDAASGRMRVTLPASKAPSWFHFQPLTSRNGTVSATATKTEGSWRYNQVTIFAASTGKKLFSLRPHPDQVNAVAISPDGAVLATGGGYTDHPWPVNAAGDARLWDLKSGRLLVVLNRHWGAVSAVAFSPDGGTLATASYDGTIKLWDLKRILR